MAELTDILAFEPAFILAAQDAIFDELQVRMRAQLDKGLVPHQYIGVNFAQGQPTGHEHPLDDGTYVHDHFQGTLSFIVRTVRESADAMQPIALHHALCAQIRAFMVGGTHRINDRLSLHRIDDYPVPQANTPEYQNDRYDYTELPYSLFFSVQSDVWPASA